MYRIRTLLPALTMLYIGIAFLATPYFIRYSYFPAGVLHDIGLLVCVGALIWLSSRRTEEQLETLLRKRNQYERHAISDVGVTSRFDVMDLVKNIPLREPRMVVINREEVPMLFEILRYALQSSAAPCRILICNWNTDEEGFSRSEQIPLATWADDMTRHLGNRRAELRVRKDRASKIFIQADDKSLLLFPIVTASALYAFAVLSRWGQPAEELRFEADELWSTAAQYENVS